VNAVKTWLITKEETHTRALDIFKDMQIRITKEGKPHLGAALGTSSYITEFVKAKVKNWSLELEQLAFIANTQPHAAFSALTPRFSKQMGLCDKNCPQHWPSFTTT